MPTYLPPFYSLGMNNGSGQGSGSDAQTPLDILEQGYDQGYDQGVTDASTPGPGGPPGTFTSAESAGGFGVNQTPLTNFDGIDITGGGDGEIYSVRLVFTGFADGLLRIKGVRQNGSTSLRNVPFLCNSGEDYVFAVDEPSGGGASAEVIFDGGGVGSISGTITVYDGSNGALIDTIIVSMTISDALLAAFETLNGAPLGGQGGVFAVESGAGALVLNTEDAMIDLSGWQAGVVATLVGAGVGTWSRKSGTDDPFGTAASGALSRFLRTGYGYHTGVNRAYAVSSTVVGLNGTMLMLFRAPSTQTTWATNNANAIKMTKNFGTSEGAVAGVQARIDSGPIYRWRVWPQFAAVPLNPGGWYLLAVVNHLTTFDLYVTNMENVSPVLGDVVSTVGSGWTPLTMDGVSIRGWGEAATSDVMDFVFAGGVGHLATALELQQFIDDIAAWRT